MSKKQKLSLFAAGWILYCLICLRLIALGQDSKSQSEAIYGFFILQMVTFLVAWFACFFKFK